MVHLALLRLADYWVRRAGPSDDIENIGASPETVHRASFGGTPLGLLTAKQYLMGGQEMARLGMAKVFAGDMQALNTFINEEAGKQFPTYATLAACAVDKACSAEQRVWRTDPALLGKNVTVLSAERIDATTTVRCHAKEGGAWCHKPQDRAFNTGVFFIGTVRADGEQQTRRGLLMCHHWDATGHAEIFQEAGLTQCHAMPVGLVAQVPAEGA